MLSRPVFQLVILKELSELSQNTFKILAGIFINLPYMQVELGTGKRKFGTYWARMADFYVSRANKRKDKQVIKTELC